MPLAAAGETAANAAITASRYVSLHTGDPSGGNEVSGGSYARVAGGSFAGSGSNPTVHSNEAAIEFPAASDTWGTVTHFGLYDASSAGNLIAYGTLAASKSVASGDVIRFPIGALDVSAD